MTKSKRLSLWLGGIGALLLLPGFLWVASYGNRLSDSDAGVALRPLMRIPLDRTGRAPAAEAFTIPGTAQWRKIRGVWSDPEFVIVAMHAPGRSLRCRVEVPVRLEATDSTGRLVPLRPGFGPYLQTAARGSELTLRAASRGTMPAGNLVVVPAWFNTKGKLVGQSLDQDTGRL